MESGENNRITYTSSRNADDSGKAKSDKNQYHYQSITILFRGEKMIDNRINWH